jgi:integrase
MCRSVLSGMCGLAARHDALERNPVRDVGPVSSGVGRRQPRALTAAEARQLRALLTYDDKAIERDLPDFVAMMLATGLRIGECVALSWTDIDLESQTVAIRGTGDPDSRTRANRETHQDFRRHADVGTPVVVCRNAAGEV